MNIDTELDIAVSEAANAGCNIFYTGGMGDFDSKFISAVRRAKHKNSDVKLVLVKPYFSNDLNVNKMFYESLYDEIIIPMEIAEAHYKAAIKLRNRWMIEKSSIVISGVYRDFGGAYDAIKYATKLEKRIITVAKK